MAATEGDVMDRLDAIIDRLDIVIALMCARERREVGYLTPLPKLDFGSGAIPKDWTPTVKE